MQLFCPTEIRLNSPTIPATKPNFFIFCSFQASGYWHNPTLWCTLGAILKADKPT